MAELADALDLGSSSREWGFKSSHPHQAKKDFSLKSFFAMIFPNGNDICFANDIAIAMVFSLARK